MDSAEAGSPEDPDEFNDHELIGLDVVTVSGHPVGRVPKCATTGRTCW